MNENLIENPVATQPESLPATLPATVPNTPANRWKAAEMPVLRRSLEELQAEQQACEFILKQALGSDSMLMPEDVRKNPKAALTMIQFARNVGIDYHEVLQNAYCVKGKIGLSTKFLIAQLLRRYYIQPRYKLTGEGETLKCTVTFVDLTRVDQFGDPLPIKDIEFTLTIQEGLASSNGSDVWKKQPKKMLMYRTAKIAIDTHFSGVLGFDSGEREEYVEWANVQGYVPSDENARVVKIIGNNPDDRFQRLRGHVQSIGMISTSTDPNVSVVPNAPSVPDAPDFDDAGENAETVGNLTAMIRNVKNIEELEVVREELSRIKKEAEQGSHMYITAAEIKVLGLEFKNKESELKS
jgi:hypothetical protein